MIYQKTKNKQKKTNKTFRTKSISKPKFSNETHDGSQQRYDTNKEDQTPYVRYYKKSKSQVHNKQGQTHDCSTTPAPIR